MDVRLFTYLVTMPDLRLARERMKTGNEKGRLEGFLLLFAAVIVAAFRACLQAEHVYLPFIVGGFAVLVLLIVITIVKPAKSDEKAGRPGHVRAPEKEVGAQKMKDIYVGAGFAFVILVTFYIWVVYYPHKSVSFFNQYAEYIFLGGAALLCILVLFARRKLRKKEEGIIEGF
ncbi:MAG: hypothetical protein AYK19_11255 [Theionarchaea archaeon DG-70-1]|nr:MAG: hypothetical protein AYK19_11255 [Theionarchaea archaeon DG-70-1]